MGWRRINRCKMKKNGRGIRKRLSLYNQVEKRKVVVAGWGEKKRQMTAELVDFVSCA